MQILRRIFEKLVEDLEDFIDDKLRAHLRRDYETQFTASLLREYPELPGGALERVKVRLRELADAAGDDFLGDLASRTMLFIGREESIRMMRGELSVAESTKIVRDALNSAYGEPVRRWHEVWGLDVLRLLRAEGYIE